MNRFSFKLNGSEVQVEGLEPHTTLLSYLRQGGLTGSKEGCAEGECGACAVLLLRPDQQGSRLEAVNGCLVLLPSIAGQEIWTVEGLAQEGELHPAQKAMLQGGSQCGYCTPGFVVSMAAEYYRKDRQGFDLEALSGNLCRCTGYRPIKDAADSLGKPAADDLLARRLQHPAPIAGSVEYEPTLLGARGPLSQNPKFYRPVTLPELFGIMAEHPTAKLVAGGTDWVVEVNQRFSRSQVQIDIDRIEALKTLHWTNHHVEIGAGITLSEAERWLHGRVPLLHQWFPLFASRLIRNRATLGGNIGTASPIGDSPPVLLALGAELVLTSPWGERRIALEQFFQGYRQTALQAGEIIKSVRIPLPLAPLAGFYKVAKRPMDDISTVAAGFALELEEGAVKSIRIGLGGVAATPVRAYRTEAALIGKPWDARTVQSAAAVARGEFEPIDDHRGSAAYRSAMLGSLLEKFFAQTLGVMA
jgi:xanthine dehydrogenase small subunit